MGGTDVDTKRIVRGSIVLGTVVLLLVAAACGGDGGDAANGGTAETASTGGDTGRYGGGGDDGGGGDGGGGDGGGEDGGAGASTVQANNFAFDPAELEIAPGENLTLKNGNANTPHTFTIDGSDVDVELAPLAEEEATIDLEPGTYDFFCRLHPQMEGTLTVT
jgi:plastocyanin